MPKMKTKQAAAKRFKVTSSGKCKRGHAYRSHLAGNKTTKQKRHLRKSSIVTSADMKRIKYELQ